MPSAKRSPVSPLKTNSLGSESPATAPPTGRPRSESARTALLETAYNMMKKHSLGEITTQGIAAKAGVSTATVYRWWDTKEALLVDAFLHVKSQNVQMAQSGSPLHRLREYLIAGGKFLQGRARACGGSRSGRDSGRRQTPGAFHREVLCAAFERDDGDRQTGCGRRRTAAPKPTCACSWICSLERAWRACCCGASRFAGRTRRRRLISPLQGRRATGVSFARNSRACASRMQLLF